MTDTTEEPTEPSPPPPAAASAPYPRATLSAPRELRLEFRGEATTYFRIWIVNLALTLLTLGIYSAWAKVRRKRYFHESTRLEGDPFEYRGRPVAILRGRLAAVVVAVALYGVTHFAPALLFVVLPVAVFAVPFLMVRTFAFNAANTAWRDVRFGFRGGYWACWRVVVAYGLLTIVTFGLGYAWLKARFTQFAIRNHAFGAVSFDVEDLKPAFLRAYGRMIGLGILGSVAVSVITMTMLSWARYRAHGTPVAHVANALTYLVYLALFAYIRVRVINATWNGASLGTVRFRSSLSARRLFGIYLTNILAMIATLGLATPWAVVRTLRYRADHMVVIDDGSLSRIDAAAAGDVAALGEEVAEMLDMDFSL